ncbi:MAG: cellulase family glycosylhydrolase [Myxococcales bacterium]|nr:cellulase family glycosylhydrolase [Myxococcales bacterium]
MPNPDLATFQAMFHNVYAAGGRVARWWFHTNGTSTPGYDASGMALPISAAYIADVKSILDTARCEHMMVLISLWSFDMLKANRVQANNLKLLTVDANRQAYIDNVLTPLVHALAGYPGLYGWETFNEPEGMATNVSNYARPFTGDGGTSVDESDIQKTVNAFASAIHEADPSALVTSGTWQFLANANVSGMKNFYSDDALQAVPGGKPDGTLDFYEVHYYASDGKSVSPFVNPVAYWGLDKRLVIGEFYALDQDGITAPNTYSQLFDTGYGGAWAWQYLNNDNTTTTTKWPTMQVPMQNLYAQSPGDLDCR